MHAAEPAQQQPGDRQGQDQDGQEDETGKAPFGHPLTLKLLPALFAHFSVGVSISAQSCERQSGSGMTISSLPFRSVVQRICSLSPISDVQAKEADDLQAVLRYNLALQVRLLIIL